jgi:hypothetical protein
VTGSGRRLGKKSPMEGSVSATAYPCVKLNKPPDSVFRHRGCHHLTYQSRNRSRQPVAVTCGELMNAQIKEANRHWRRKRHRWEGDPDRITWFNKVFGDRIIIPL